MANSETKMLKEIFKDFEINSNIINSKIESINLYKKTNKLEINIISDKPIKIKDVGAFEKYLSKRFMIKETAIHINYSEDVKTDYLSDWNDILDYLAYKHPLTKALLKNSSLSEDGNCLNINLKLSGSDILYGGNMDVILSNTLKNIYGINLKVKYIDNNSKETKEEVLEYRHKMEEEIIKKAQEKAEQESKATQEVEHKAEIAESKKIEQVNNVEEQKEKIEKPEQKADKEEPQEITPLILGRNQNIKDPLTKVIDISIDTGKLCIEGEIINTDSRELKSGKILFMFDLYDGTSTITCKAFIEQEKFKDIAGRIKSAKGVRIGGTAQFDPFAKEIGVIANTIVETAGMKKESRMDEAKEKRVELHMHTQMSQMDAITSATDLIKRAMKWGMKSIAITDHGVVQAFPEAHKLLGFDNKDMKIIYGVEAYLVPDQTPSVSFPKDQDIDTTYCVLDLETTGFSFRTEKITEVGIMKVKNGEVIDEFSCFVNPEKPIPQRVIEVTNITDDMVKDAETIDVVMPKIIEFVGDSVLVAHNADFDIGFLKYNAKLLGLSLENTYIDTLRLAKALFPDYTKYKLGIIAENLGIKVEVAHRALDDVDTTVKVLNVMMQMLKDKGVKKVSEIDEATIRKC